jgi:CheY-like chemotaxis protein
MVMPRLQTGSLHVVLVDDDEVDAEAVARLLHREHAPFQLTTFPNGYAAEEALGGPFGRRLLADRYLFLLDLNMPRVSGFEFLAWLRARPEFRNAIVFVFTTSEAESDRRQAYEYHVAGYLSKSGLGNGYGALLPFLAAYDEAVTFPPS